MKLKMITTMAGPDGCVNAGDVADIDPTLADALIAGGYAVALDGAADLTDEEIAEKVSFAEDQRLQEMLDKQMGGPADKAPADFQRSTDLVGSKKRS